MRLHKIKTQQLILKLEKYYPKDNLITNYQDFLKHRDYLPYYEFNINVFEALIDLSNATWHSPLRINRVSILALIRRYGYKKIEKNNSFYYSFFSFKQKKPSEELILKLFYLFKRCYDDNVPLTEDQLFRVESICNSMLVSFSLPIDCLHWLGENAFRSRHILNRLIKYKTKSDYISNWVKKHYNDDELRTRRAELVSWLIDKDLNFEISHQTIINDFEYFNALDEKEANQFIQEKEMECLLLL